MYTDERLKELRNIFEQVAESRKITADELRPINYTPKKPSIKSRVSDLIRKTK